MENLIENLENKENLIQTISNGGFHEGLQILLSGNNNFVVNRNNIIYQSEGIKFCPHYEKTEDEKMIIEIMSKYSKNTNDSSNTNSNTYNVSTKYMYYDNNFLKCMNYDKDLKYIGVSKSGKIIAINLLLNNNMFIHKDYIIGFNSNVSLLTHDVESKSNFAIGVRKEYVLASQSKELSIDDLYSKVYIQSDCKN